MVIGLFFKQDIIMLFLFGGALNACATFARLPRGFFVVVVFLLGVGVRGEGGGVNEWC